MLPRETSRLRGDRLLLGSSALLLAALVPSFASCADTEQTTGPVEDASTTLGETSTDAGVDADAHVEGDSGCRPSDPNCVTHVLTCDEAAWCPVPTTVSTLFTLTSVWGSSKDDIWAVGSGGTIIHYDGTAWTRTPTEPPSVNTFRGVWGSGPNDVWVVSRTDVIFHTTGFANGKATWTPEPGPGAELPEQRAATAVWGTGPNDVRIAFAPRSLASGWYNQWVKADQGRGPTWSLAMGQGAVFAFWGTADDVWYVADNSEANLWQRGLTAHGTPGSSGEMNWTFVDSQSNVNLEGIWGSGPNDIWAVGDSGTIRHLVGGASRWEIVASPTTEALHGIWGSSANDVWAVGDNGTILHFDGTKWRKSSAAFAIGKKPRLAAIWGSGPNDIWIVGDAVSLHYTGPKPGVQETE